MIIFSINNNIFEKIEIKLRILLLLKYREILLNICFVMKYFIQFNTELKKIEKDKL